MSSAKGGSLPSGRSTVAAPASTGAPTVAASTPAPTRTPWRYRTYANARFGFSVQIPATFTAEMPPEDGDGRAFQSPDRQAQVTVFGANNVGNDTPSGALMKERSQVTSHGGRVTYSFAGADYFICSGYARAGSIFYVRTVVYPHAEYTVDWSYPSTRKTYFDPPVQHSVATFRPGPNRSA